MATRQKRSSWARPFWLSCWSDLHFDWLDHPSWPDPAGIDLAFRWDRSRTHSPETTHTLGKHKPAETPWNVRTYTFLTVGNSL